MGSRTRNSSSWKNGILNKRDPEPGAAYPEQTGSLTGRSSSWTNGILNKCDPEQTGSWNRSSSSWTNGILNKGDPQQAPAHLEQKGSRTNGTLNKWDPEQTGSWTRSSSSWTNGILNGRQGRDVLSKSHWQVKMPQGTLSSHTRFFHSVKNDLRRDYIMEPAIISFCLLLNPRPPPSLACAIPSRTWHISQTSHRVSLERENADLGWSALCLHKIRPYLLIRAVEEICDQQSMSKTRNSHMSNVFLQVRKGKRQKTSPWVWCQTGAMLTTSLLHRRQPLNKH